MISPRLSLSSPSDIASATSTPTTNVTTSSTSTPAPSSPLAPPPTGGSLTAAVLSGAVVAAVVSGWVNAVLARRTSRLEERARIRTTLAEAYQAYADYKEFPYAIRRRRSDQPAEERIRLSEEIRRTQSRLSYYQAWTLAESPETGAAYNELVTQLRRIAGTSMRAAWQEPALDEDAGMNIGSERVDLTELREVEQAFLQVAKSYLSAFGTSFWWRAVRGR